jgi:hypothetical protein
MTPKVCIVMGTPKGKSIFGINPSTASNAANNEVSAIGKATALDEALVVSALGALLF